MRHDSFVRGTATYADQTWHIYMSHVSCEWIRSHVKEWYLIDIYSVGTDDARGHGAADVRCCWRVMSRAPLMWLNLRVTESCLTWKGDIQLIYTGGTDDARGQVAGKTRHPAHINESCRMRMSHVSCEKSCTIDTYRWYGWCERPSCRWREAFRWCNLFFQLLLLISVRCTSPNAEVICMCQLSHVRDESQWLNKATPSSYCYSSAYVALALLHESCPICMSHVSHVWVMSQVYESCLTCISHVSHLWVMSHMYESCLTCMSHVSRVCDVT